MAQGVRARLQGMSTPQGQPFPVVSWSAAPCWSRHSPWLMEGSALRLSTVDTDGFLPVPSFQTQLSDKPVQDRGLVVTDPRAEDVVLEHRSYCAAKARERHVAGDVLGYVTPVSWALVCTGWSPGQGGNWGLHLHGGGAAGQVPAGEAAGTATGPLGACPHGAGGPMAPRPEAALGPSAAAGGLSRPPYATSGTATATTLPRSSGASSRTSHLYGCR